MVDGVRVCAARQVGEALGAEQHGAALGLGRAVIAPASSENTERILKLLEAERSG